MALIDNFNRADEDPLAGPNWDAGVNNSQPRLVSNAAAAASGGAFSDAHWFAEQFAAGDHEVGYVVSVKPGTTESVHLRLKISNQTNTWTGYYISLNGAETLVFRKATSGAGTFTQIGNSETLAFASGDRIVFRHYESTGTMEVWKNGALAVTCSATDTQYASQAGYLGFGLAGANTRIDDFEGGVVAAGGGASIAPYAMYYARMRSLN